MLWTILETTIGKKSADFRKGTVDFSGEQYSDSIKTIFGDTKKLNRNFYFENVPCTPLNQFSSVGLVDLRKITLNLRNKKDNPGKSDTKYIKNTCKVIKKLILH